MQSRFKKTKLIIGTRGSPLALLQAEQVKRSLIKFHSLNDDDIIIIKTISTAGDKTQKDNMPMSKIGSSGVFSKEIEEQLVNKKIDVGVHSAKDMASSLENGLVMDIFLKREDARDAFISLKYASIKEIPKGATIGTSSVRRKAQILRFRPDLKIVEFRGNVNTRLKKLEQNIVSATFLAAAGLNRMGLQKNISQYLDMKDFLPAPAQGAIGLEYRQNDEETREYLKPLNHEDTFLAVKAERAFLRVMDGSCRTPIAAFANIEGDKLALRGQILSLDGQVSYYEKISGALECAEQMGIDVANLLLSKADGQFFKQFNDD